MILDYEIYKGHPLIANKAGNQSQEIEVLVFNYIIYNIYQFDVRK
jgi:hypothetical protein